MTATTEMQEISWFTTEHKISQLAEGKRYSISFQKPTLLVPFYLQFFCPINTDKPRLIQDAR